MNGGMSASGPKRTCRLHRRIFDLELDINETRPSLQFCGAKSLASDYRTF